MRPAGLVGCNCPGCSLAEAEVLGELPRWRALESLDLACTWRVAAEGPDFAAAMAASLRHLCITVWSFLGEGPGAPAAWPRLRSLHVDALRPDEQPLAEQLGEVQLPALERLEVRVGPAADVADFLDGLPGRAAALPALRALALTRCFCGDAGCGVAGCGDAEAAARVGELRQAWPGLEVRRARSPHPDDWLEV